MTEATAFEPITDAPRRLEDEDYRVQTVRDKVLEALDDAALEIYGRKPLVLDEDLPELFETIDEMANRMLQRAAS